MDRGLEQDQMADGLSYSTPKALSSGLLASLDSRCTLLSSDARGNKSSTYWNCSSVRHSLQNNIRLGLALENTLSGVWSSHLRGSKTPKPAPAPVQSMADETLVDEAEHNTIPVTNSTNGSTHISPKPIKSKSRNRDKESAASAKRRCVSTACIACRRRKSKVRQKPTTT